MVTFGNYLKGANVEEGLTGLLLDLSKAFPRVAVELRKFETGHAGSENVYGEKQLKADLVSNDLFLHLLQEHPRVCSIASEELEGEFSGKGGDNGYSVAFDPLDGSSLVDVNLSIGSIFGFYQGKGFVGRKGSEQAAALIVVYGPCLTFMITVGKGVFEFLHDEEKGEFVMRDEVKFSGDRKLFAPGNLRACTSEAWYLDLLEYWAKNDYTLRYSGGMVPDVNQILKKGSGVFVYPGYKEKPEGKLRLLFECAPMAFLAEQAGGMAVSESGRILDIEIRKIDQKTPVFLGAKRDVELVLSYLKK